MTPQDELASAYFEGDPLVGGKHNLKKAAQWARCLINSRTKSEREKGHYILEQISLNERGHRKNTSKGKKLLLMSVVYLNMHGTVFSESLDSSCWYKGADGYSEQKQCFESIGDESLRLRSVHLRSIKFDEELAPVWDKEHNWMFVDRKGKVVVKHVMTMDNGPDYVQDGFVRYKEKGKCGYTDLKQTRTILPRFDGCLPFEQGVARVCIGCRLEDDGEHSWYAGGDSFCINTNGKRVDCLDAEKTAGANEKGQAISEIEEFDGKKYLRLRIFGEPARQLCALYGFPSSLRKAFIGSKNDVTCGADGKGQPFFGYLIESESLKRSDLESHGYK